MKRTLSEWQAHLEHHFAELCDQRKDHPVFALEHGLSETEIENLQFQLNQEFQNNDEYGREWLPWVVHAAEVGYRFEGGEFWSTFEEHTPDWTQYGKRETIKTFFEKFHEEYRGAEPKGLWAKHFSIIGWPITHAIVAKDLQRHLARSLHELSRRLHLAHFESVQTLGKFIAQHSTNCSNRFHKFLHQPEFVGQIARSLLHSDEDQSEYHLLHPITLKRIIQDIEQVKQSKQFLRGFQSKAKRVLRSGFGAVHNRHQGGRAGITPLKLAERLTVTPKLELRLTHDDKCNLVLAIPDLSLFLSHIAGAEIALHSRCRVTGSDGGPKSRRWTRRKRKVTLDRLPRHDEVLLRFDGRCEELEDILKTDFQLPSGNKLLFQLRRDGVATLIKQPIIRSGREYCLLTRQDVPPLFPHQRLETNFRDGFAFKFAMPAGISEDLHNQIESSGLKVGQAIRIWPAGLPAAVWDGEGYVEWNFGQRAVIGIDCDFAVEAIYLWFHGKPEDGYPEELKLGSCEARAARFVELPDLPVGEHTLYVSARRTGSTKDDQGELKIVIRETNEVSPDEGHGVLRLLTDPSSPTLEQFWSNKVRMEFIGIPGLSFRPKLTLYENNRSQVLFEKMLPKFTFPVEPKDWHEKFSAHILRDVEAQKAFDGAEKCELDFDLGNFGTSCLELERDFAPICWSVRRDGSRYRLRLNVDMHIAKDKRVVFRSFEKPDVNQPVSAEQFLEGFSALERGGLYRAECGEESSSVLVPQATEMRGLDELVIQPEISNYSRSPRDILKIIRFIGQWRQSRTIESSVANMRRRSVLNCFVDKLVLVIAGERWRTAELAWAENPTSAPSFELIDSALTNNRSVSGRLRRLLEECDDYSFIGMDERIQKFADYMRTNSLVPHNDVHILSGAALRNMDAYEILADFILRLATGELTQDADHYQAMNACLSVVLHNPELFRAGRFIVLNSQYLNQLTANESFADCLYDSWIFE